MKKPDPRKDTMQANWIGTIIFSEVISYLPFLPLLSFFILKQMCCWKLFDEDLPIINTEAYKDCQMVPWLVCLCHCQVVQFLLQYLQFPQVIKRLIADMHSATHIELHLYLMCYHYNQTYLVVRPTQCNTYSCNCMSCAKSGESCAVAIVLVLLSCHFFYRDLNPCHEKSMNILRNGVTDRHIIHGPKVAIASFLHHHPTFYVVPQSICARCLLLVTCRPNPSVPWPFGMPYGKFWAPHSSDVTTVNCLLLPMPMLMCWWWLMKMWLLQYGPVEPIRSRWRDHDWDKCWKVLSTSQ